MLLYNSDSYDHRRKEAAKGSISPLHPAQLQVRAMKLDGTKMSFPNTTGRLRRFLKYRRLLKQHMFASIVVGRLILPMARVQMLNPAEEISFETGYHNVGQVCVRIMYFFFISDKKKQTLDSQQN